MPNVLTLSRVSRELLDLEMEVIMISLSTSRIQTQYWGRTLEEDCP